MKEKSKEGSLIAIRKELNDKDAEIEKLILEVESQKKRGRAKSSFEGKEDSSLLKRKLAEANQKLVSLLQEKAEMHRELQYLKGESS